MATTVTAARLRRTADERRDQLIKAAVREFAERGYQAASTAAIARRAGISQPYIYALFASKEELFIAVHDDVVDRLITTFSDAVEGATPQARLDSMGMLYPSLIADRYQLMVQLQSYATGEPAIVAHVARRYGELYQTVLRLSGATPVEVSLFFACGMLANVTTALGIPEICDPLFADAPHTDAAVAGQ